MKQWLAATLSIIFGFSSGIIIATAVLAFIAAIGIIPRIAAKLDARTHYLAFGTAAILGSTLGSYLSIWDVVFIVPKFLVGIFSLFVGIFIGCLAIALAEVVNVIPIAKNRMKLKKGMRAMIVFFALGKVVGSLYYWFYPAFNIK